MIKKACKAATAVPRFFVIWGRQLFCKHTWGPRSGPYADWEKVCMKCGLLDSILGKEYGIIAPKDPAEEE